MSTVAGGIGLHPRQQTVSGKDLRKHFRLAILGGDPQCFGHLGGPGDKLRLRHGGRKNAGVTGPRDLAPAVLALRIGGKFTDETVVEGERLQGRGEHPGCGESLHIVNLSDERR